ncbi:hypothetical protein Rvan_2457 [Rhodomicrobium vannielii ATCC 17100]|uniref:Uncharacterized protein n=1 Tax=Rhodomicrobium vannielii (strain ATCC 17100 / DSM 162 / LMG 4299 / NCIMB 10020 / ATH 3.1.1) TaxID=648757 RepID=E3I5F2_RHOVT|nr:hypothetical protein Rvan_2457 [Rhodomicrobium vannielii ATCC 17100]
MSPEPSLWIIVDIKMDVVALEKKLMQAPTSLNSHNGET